jgi:hypothetical protein
MRKFLIKIYLWFHGVCTCEHPTRSLRYCLTCDEKAQAKRFAKYIDHDVKLRLLQKEVVE